MCKDLPERNNWENLVVPFAEAICAMSDQSLGVLEEYWASLQEAAFIRLVQMFKRAVTAQLHYWTESSENNYHVKALLEILKKLHRVRILPDTHRFYFCGKKSPGFNWPES